jgi:hypothetical protein
MYVFARGVRGSGFRTFEEAALFLAAFIIFYAMSLNKQQGGKFFDWPWRMLIMPRILLGIAVSLASLGFVVWMWKDVLWRMVVW